MKITIIKIISFIKGFILAIRPHVFLGWLRQPLLMSSNIIGLSSWIAKQDNKNVLNDFYTPNCDYSKRYQLYKYVFDKLNLENEVIDYLEFGVCGGYSFRWWINECKNGDSNFYGFDTFEGLPENWGTYNKGDMAAAIPELEDKRVKFFKGLFQDTVPNFLTSNHLKNGKR